jgi:hypothetical protein
MSLRQFLSSSHCVNILRPEQDFESSKIAPLQAAGTGDEPRQDLCLLFAELGKKRNAPWLKELSARVNEHIK